MLKMHVVSAVGNGMFWASVAATLWGPRLLRTQDGTLNKGQGVYALPVLAVIIGVVLHLLIKDDIPTAVAWKVWVVTFALTSAILLWATYQMVLYEGGRFKLPQFWTRQTGIVLPVTIILLVGLPVGTLYNFFAVELAKANAAMPDDKGAQGSGQGDEDDGSYSDVAVISGAESAVKAKLVDPDSAKFRNVVVRQQSSGAKAVCGEVNAKNRAGGYNGFEGFISAGTNDYTWLQQETKDFATAWNQVCVSGVPAENVNAEDASGGATIPVPSDPRATYQLLSLKKLKGGKVSIVTQREGPSGESFSRRLVNCANLTSRYTGDGSTLAEMEASASDPNMGGWEAGAISKEISRYACRHR